MKDMMDINGADWSQILVLNAKHSPVFRPRYSKWRLTITYLQENLHRDQELVIIIN